MIVNSKDLLQIQLLEILPELSSAAQTEVATAVSHLTNAKELQRIHIREWLPYVSLDTLKAISALINKEIGINETDTAVK